ncbi:hypothetical protein VIGAN_01537400, partial [Vigna angularis var. angularis]
IQNQLQHLQSHQKNAKSGILKINNFELDSLSNKIILLFLFSFLYQSKQPHFLLKTKMERNGGGERLTIPILVPKVKTHTFT